MGEYGENWGEWACMASGDEWASMASGENGRIWRELASMGEYGANWRVLG